MSTFIQRLNGGNTEIRQARINQIVTGITARLNSDRQRLNAERLRLQAELDVLLDVGPDHEQSLRPASATFNPDAFVVRVEGLQAQLFELEQSFEVHNRTRAAILGVETPVEANGIA